MAIAALLIISTNMENILESLTWTKNMNKPGWFRPNKTENSSNETWPTFFLIAIRAIFTNYWNSYKRTYSTQYLVTVIRESLLAILTNYYENTHSKQHWVIIIREISTSSSSTQYLATIIIKFRTAYIFINFS